jgi:hypothetical protein
MHEMLVNLRMARNCLELARVGLAIPIVLASVPLKHGARFGDLPD